MVIFYIFPVFILYILHGVSLLNDRLAHYLSMLFVGALCERPRAIEDRPYKIVANGDTLIFNFQLSIFNCAASLLR